MTTLQKIRLLEGALSAFVISMIMESMVTLESKYVTIPHPGLMSIIFGIGSIMQAQQVLCNKFPIKLSLWMPISIDLCITAISLVLYHKGMYQQLIIMECIATSMTSILFMNRKNILIQYISSDRTYLNMMGSAFGIGGILGMILSAILLQFMDPLEVWFTHICLLFCLIPIHVKVNIEVFKLVKSKSFNDKSA